MFLIFDVMKCVGKVNITLRASGPNKGYLVILTVCPRSSEPFYIVTYYTKWGTTSWTDGR